MMTRAAVRSWREALVATYSFRCIGALLVILPVVTAAQASGVTQFPEHDRLLFEAGGALLSEVLVSQRAALVAGLPPTLAMLAVLAILALGPELLLLRAATSTYRAPIAASSQAPAPNARRLLQQLLTLGAATLLFRVLLAGVSLGLAFSARSWFASARDPRVPDAVFASMIALGAVAQLAVSTLRDLAAAVLVARGLPLPESIAAAAGKLRLPAFGAHAAAFGATSALVLSGALLAGAVSVARGELWRTPLVFVIHQAVVLGSIAARAAWLASAARRVAS